MQFTLTNGNKQPYQLGLPTLMLYAPNLNKVALDHIKENTGLVFKGEFDMLTAKPTSTKQIVALLMTYNFTTTMYDNWQYTNTIMLKFKCSCSTPCC